MRCLLDKSQSLVGHPNQLHHHCHDCHMVIIIIDHHHHKQIMTMKMLTKKGHMVAPSMAALRQQSLSFCYGCRRLQAQGVEGHVLGDVLDAGNPLGILLALELHTQSRIRWT